MLNLIVYNRCILKARRSVCIYAVLYMMLVASNNCKALVQLSILNKIYCKYNDQTVN